MILGLIFSILSVTYTVASSNTVEVNGEEPMSSNAIFTRSSTTGQKGQMTSGNTTTLQLTGWDGCILDSVVLSMHSNTSQGAGSLTMHIGERLVWKIADADFAHDTWYGSYTTNWVDITHHIGKKVNPNETIEIHIKASKNSLYIQHYTLYYSLPDPKAYEVRLISGLSENPTPMIEEQIGAGVVLPAGVDTLEWRFLGWSEREVLKDSVSPALMQAGMRYYPKCDCMLWAVYSDGEGNVHHKNGESGEYVLASSLWQIALKGGVVGETISTTPATIETTADGEQLLLTGTQESMIYYLDFKPDNIVDIWHIGSRTWIGHEGTRLTDSDEEWQYRVLEDGSYCFYYNDNGQQRMLSLGYGKDGSSNQLIAFVNRANVDVMTGRGFLLFATENVEMTTFTTWPFGKLNSVEDVLANDKKQGEYMMYLGNVILRVKNGKKMLMMP